MDISLKVVTKLPLEKLWGKEGSENATRREFLSADEIANLLRSGRIQFIVADVGISPHWINPSDCYQFWKDEVRTHLAVSSEKASRKEFPDHYFYFASLWDNATSSIPLVVLEKHH
jgi:hypothetical protein